MSQALLDRHVQTGAIAGAVALVTVGDIEAMTTAGVQDSDMVLTSRSILIAGPSLCC